MMIKVHLDFETRSRLSLKKFGAWAYSRDPSTDVWCAAYWVEGSPGDVQIWYPGQPVPEVFAQRDEPVVVIAHNYFFEQSILMNIMWPRYGWKMPATYECTMALAMRYNLPASLSELSNRLGLAERKDTEAGKIMVKMANRKRYDENKEGSTAHKRFLVDFATLSQYCKQDVRTEIQVYNWFKDRGRTVDRTEFELDRKMNLRGIRCDTQTAKSVFHTCKLEEANLNRRLHELTGGVVDTAKQIKAFQDWLQDHGYGFNDLTASSVEESIENPAGLDSFAYEALKIRQSLSLGSVSKYAVMLYASDRDHRLRGLFQLYGASQTGRWAGRLVQWHNLPRMSLSDAQIEAAINMFRLGDVESIRMVFGDVFQTAKELIRPMFIGEGDSGLVVSDLSQIECRVNAWLAGCDAMMQILSDPDRDPYAEMAGIIFNRPASRCGKKTDNNARQLGKCAILGLGFSMGAEQFQRTVQAWTGIKISDEESQRIVDLFREEFSEIPRFWWNLDSSVKAVISHPIYKHSQVGHLKLWKDDRDDELVIQLPNNRTLHYPRLHLRTSEINPRGMLTFQSATGQWVKLYGGKICENVVQATARDVITEAMIGLDQAGYDIIGTVHDEVVIENAGQKEVDNIHRIVSTVPAWCTGLPLAAETDFAERYTK